LLGQRQLFGLHRPIFTLARADIFDALASSLWPCCTVIVLMNPTLRHSRMIFEKSSNRHHTTNDGS
jgi:hypothetical protein